MAVFRAHAHQSLFNLKPALTFLRRNRRERDAAVSPAEVHLCAAIGERALYGLAFKADTEFLSPPSSRSIL
jgi:hypothetical protein